MTPLSDAALAHLASVTDRPVVPGGHPGSRSPSRVSAPDPPSRAIAGAGRRAEESSGRQSAPARPKGDRRATSCSRISCPSGGR